MQGLSELFNNLLETGPDFWLGVLLIVIAAYPVPAGLGPLVSHLIDLLKVVGLVKDNNAGKWNLGISFVLAAALAWLVRAGLPEAEANTYIGIATQILAVFALAAQTFREAAKAFGLRKQAGTAYSNTLLKQAQQKAATRKR